MKLRSIVLSAAAAALFAAPAFGAITINEIRGDQPGSDTDEYFELAGNPGESLNGLHYITIGDGTGGSGVIEAVVDLTGLSIPAGGFFLCGEVSPLPTFGVAPDLVADLAFENSDNITHLIVSGFTGSAGDDLDTNDDCVLDVTPWTGIIDSIALIEEENPPVSTECHYGPPTLGPDGPFVPGHAYRCSDTGDWAIGEFDPVIGVDSPRAANPSCANPPPSVIDEGRDPCVPLTNTAADITATVLNATGANVSYTVDGGSATTVAMNLDSTSGDTTFFSATLPGQATNGALVEYQVSAYNANPDTTDSFGQGYWVGTVDIADLRVNDGSGNNIYEFYGARVVGNVTVENGIFSSTAIDGYIQDATGGIKLFEFDPNTAWTGANRGDELEVAGTLDQFNGELELTSGGACDSLFITPLGPGAVPAPKDGFPCDVGEENEGLLMTIFYTEIDTTGLGPDWVGNNNYDILNCNGANPDIRIDADTNIPGTPVLSLQNEVTGVIGQFFGYQLKPREVGDIVPVNVTTGTPGDRGPATLSLLQNSPNPFSRVTDIRFVVPPMADNPDAVQEVTLEVFDVTGRVVAKVMDDYLAAGEYDVTLSANDMGDAPAGVYFYRLTVGEQEMTRKLVLQN